MNKMISPLPTSSFTMERFPSSMDGQLIVLVSEDADSGAAVRRVWQRAHASCRQVQLLSLYSDPAREPGLRRMLVTMASLLQNGDVSAEIRVEMGTNWVEAVKRNAHPDDTIVCFAGQRAGLWNRPLSQILQASLSNPVYIVPDLSPQDPPRAARIPEILAWAGSIVLLAIAFVFQVQIVSMTEGWLETTLLILSALAEAWLLGVWNSLFR